MKVGWELKALAELFQTVTGNTPPKSEARYYGRAVPLVKPPELTDGPVFESADGLSLEGAKLARIAPKGSVLVSCIGNLGKVGLAERDLAFNQQINAIYPMPKQALPRFMFYQALAPQFRLQLEALATGTTVSIVNKSRFNSISVPLPPLEEQQRIVAILDEAFEGLDRARANAEANLHNARDLFDNSLIQVFDEITNNAARMTLADASISFGRGRSRHRPRNAPILYGGAYPFVQTGDVRNSDGTVLEYSQTYNELGLAQSKLWPLGTICITIAANIAETAVLGFDACFPDSIIGMVADPKVTFPEYVEYMLRYFAAGLKALGKGSAQDNINLATFESATFPFPSLEKQRQIVEKLSALSSNTASLAEIYRSKISDVGNLRQSLLQKAFAGELT